MRTGCCVAVMILLGLAAGAGAAKPVPAFPGAEGFGTFTAHARGKPVFHVTRLDDTDAAQQVRHFKDAPGQFRHALALAAEAGGGYIVFDVAGTIQLRRTAQIPSNCYVAGQTAPGGGVAIEGAAIVIGGRRSPVRDVVVRHLRYRGNAPRGADAFNIIGEGTGNVVLDHVSVSFFRDGAVDIVAGAKDVTVQWSHLGDAYFSGTDEAYHCEPHLLRDGVNRVSLHHNFYTHCHSRMPQAQDSCQKDDFRIEFSNNVVYDYRKYPTNFDVPNGKANVVGNYYVPGPYTHGDGGGSMRGLVTGKNNFTVHVRDNRAVGGVGHDDAGCPGSDQDTCRGNDQWVTGARPDDSKPETAIMGKAGAIGPTPGVLNYAEQPIEGIPPVTYLPAEENLDAVIATFGAWPRDNTDRRLADELLTRTGEWKLEIPDDQNVYARGARGDGDRDGMADKWESAHGGNLRPNGHDLHPVYENIEVYLQQLAEHLLKAAEPIAAHETVLKATAELKEAMRSGKQIYP